MLNFLKQTRKLLNSKDLVCIVIGNESCDLDSAVCAINLAYLYDKNDEKFHNCEVNNFLPVLNVPRADYALKTEVNHIFNEHGIKVADLTFRDELQDEFLDNCKYILVDHHVSNFASRCLHIFDHRPRDSTIIIPNSCQLHLENVGSCATLIGEHFIQANCTGEAFKSSLTMLRDTIILDTVNFSESAGRATAKDHAICEQLENILNTTVATREQIFKNLVHARADVSQLTAVQLLRKDLKIITNKKKDIKVALPGFPISVQDFIAKPSAEESIKEFCKMEQVNVILLMGLQVLEDGSVKRDIGLIDINSCRLWMAIRDELLQSTKLNLQLEPLDCNKMKKVCLYQQKNVEKTRKHVLPIVKNVLECHGN